jgi:AcrR family transcriptional regulator
VTAAETIALRDGLDRLTFQAIGSELDAHPTSLYRHFRDKDELMLALIDTLRTRSYAGVLVPTDDWVADLRAQAHLIHDHYLRYPDFALQRAVRRPTDVASMEFTIGALRRGGYSPEEAGLYARALGQLVRSASSIQAAIEAMPTETRVADDMTWELDRRRLDLEAHPSLGWVGEHLPDVRDPRAWEVALDLMLDSIARRAPGSAPA